MYCIASIIFCGGRHWQVYGY